MNKDLRLLGFYNGIFLFFLIYSKSPKSFTFLTHNIIKDSGPWLLLWRHNEQKESTNNVVYTCTRHRNQFVSSRLFKNFSINLVLL